MTLPSDLQAVESEHLREHAEPDAELATGRQPSPEPSTSSSCSELTFTLFSSLPRELRDYVWELCRPHRVYEIDDRYWNCAQAERIFVFCRESRAVALRSGFMDFDGIMQPDPPLCIFPDHHRKAANPGWSWWDARHMSATMNFCAFARPEKPPQGLPLESLVWYTNRLKGTPCLHLEYLQAHGMITMNMLGPLSSGQPVDPDDLVEIERALIKQHPVWHVVMHTLVMHCAMEDLDGEFGLLNDAPIRLLDPVEDILTIKAVWCKLDALDIQHNRVRKQDWRDPECFSRWLPSVLSRWPASLRHHFRPMVMIRHCLGNCNLAVRSNSKPGFTARARFHRPRGLKVKSTAVEGIGEVPFGWDEIEE